MISGRVPDAGYCTDGKLAAAALSFRYEDTDCPADVRRMMAYVAFFYRGEEVDRRELNGPLVIGRSAECDVVVRDILLSRRHCRIEPEAGGWSALDLASKNGTRVGDELVTRRTLKDGDTLLMGKTRALFHEGAFVPGPPRPTPALEDNEPSPRRPADPFEALSSTLSGQAVIRPDKSRPEDRFPRPRPSPSQRPLEARDELGDFPTGIPSGAPDSIDLDAPSARPRRPAVKPNGDSAVAKRITATVAAPKRHATAPARRGRWTSTIQSLRQSVSAVRRWLRVK